MIFVTTLNISPEKLGLLIGKSGSNYKKIIIDIKKKILGKENNISDEEWSSINILLRFEKDENNVKAIIDCKECELEIIKGVLNKESEFLSNCKKYKHYNQYNSKKTEKKENMIFAFYTDDISSVLIESLKMNINNLKSSMSSIPLIYSIYELEILESVQDDSKIIKLGNIKTNNYLGIRIVINGNPEIKHISSVIDNFVNNKIYTIKLFDKIKRFKIFEEEVHIYNWCDSIGQNKEYGYYSKQSEVSHIKRCISV